jgi:hypothetical protein
MKINTREGGENKEYHEMNPTVHPRPLGTQTHLRNAAHIAASQLQDQGYTDVKAAMRSWPYDLMAFNHHHMLLIATRRHTKQQTAKQIT